jgi:hypothetical protein
MTHPCWEPSPSAAERAAVNVDLKMVYIVRGTNGKFGEPTTGLLVAEEIQII